MSTDLVRRTNARELVREYQRAARRMRYGFRLIDRALTGLTSAFPEGKIHCYVREFHGSRVVSVNWSDPEPHVKHLEKDAWAGVVDRLQLRDVLSPKRNEDLSKMLERGEMPPLTEDNVMAFANSVREQLGTFIEECVVECYDWLRPRQAGHGAGQYKSNSPWQVNARIVLPFVLEGRRTMSSWWVHHHTDVMLSALERTMQLLDGKGAAGRDGGSHLWLAIRAIPGDQPCVGETEYFRFKGFRNGNLHLWFKRLNLLAEFNRIAGKSTLKEAS